MTIFLNYWQKRKKHVNVTKKKKILLYIIVNIKKATKLNKNCTDTTSNNYLCHKNVVVLLFLTVYY